MQIIFFSRACRSTLLLIGALIFALTVPRPVAAQMVYSAGAGMQFGTINVTSGAYTPIGTGYTTYNGTNTLLSGVAYAADGSLYGLDYTARLFQINRNSGALTLVGTVSGFTDTTQDLSIGNTADGTIYMFYAANMTSGPNIYKINPTTAVATLLGSSGSTYFDGGIGGDGSGNMFATGGSGGNQTFKLNITNGTATQLVAASGAGTTYALGYTNSHLYAFGSGGAIYTIDTTTGLATDTNVTYSTASAGVSQGVAPLVFVATAPEPGSIVLLILAGTAVAAGRTRRTRG